jgi:hypothetical protein
LDFDGPQNDERWQAKRNNLADKLTVEAEAVADQKSRRPSPRASAAPSRPAPPGAASGELLGVNDEDVVR